MCSTRGCRATLACRKALTAEDAEDAEERKSFTAKDAKAAKEQKILTAKDTKDAKGTIIRTEF